MKLWAALLLLVAINAAWLYRDHSLPAWDDAYYLTQSLRAYDALTDHGVVGFGSQFLRGMSSKPPLIAAVPIPIYLVAGRHPRAARLANLGFLFIILIATYLLAEEYAGETAGLVALCIAGTMPMIYGLTRNYLVECGLTALVILALYLLARADQDSLWAPGLLGIVFGLGLLMKASFPLYVAAPFLWVLFRRRRGGSKAFVIPVVLIAGPWYAVHASEAVRRTAMAGTAATARIYNTGGLAEAGQYLGNVVNCGPGLYFLALPLLAALCIGRISAAGRRGILFCVLTALPILFLALSHYRDLRYAAPMFPAVAVALGVLASAAMSRFPAATAGVILLLAVGAADMLDASFGFTSRRFAGGLLLSVPRFSYVQPPQPQTPPYHAFLSALRKRLTVDGSHRLVLACDTPTINADNVALSALTARIPLDVGTTAYAEPADLPQMLASADYFAYVENAADSPLNPLGRPAIARAVADPRFREVLSTVLPDGARLHLLQSAKRREGERLVQTGALIDSLAPAECSVRFTDGIELTGFSLRTGTGGFEARYRWRAWKQIPRNYWSFGHILDAKGNVLAYLDHSILPQTSTSQWQIGDSALEKVVVRIPSGLPAAVRLGVFDRQTGDRVKILSSSFPVGDSGTSTTAPIP